MTRLIKNLLDGAGSIFSLSPPKRHTRNKRLYKPHKSAMAAFRADWKKIGGDFDNVLKRVAHVED